MLEKSNTWPEQVLDTLNSCWRALLESLSNTQANVRCGPLPAPCVWSVVQPLYGPCYMDPVASLGTVFTVSAALFSGASRTTIGSIGKVFESYA